MINELSRIRGLATDIVLMADNFETDFSIKHVSEMAEEITETAGKLINDIIAAEKTDIFAGNLRCI